MTKFNKDFIRTWEKMKEKYGEDFEVLNGLSEGHLDNTMFLDKLSKTKVVADASIDSSANVKSRNINTIRKEMSKPSEKLVAFHKIFITLKKMFGLRVAKEWMEAEWNKALYLHDFHSSSFIPYCFAYDLTRMVEEGLFWLPDQRYAPAKHLETFVDFVKEFISFNSNLTSGACGLPNLIPYMYYYWNKDIKSKHYPRCQSPMVFAKSEIQRLIYAINQPYCRDGIQSAFVNTSIFDSEYFDALFGGATFPDGEFMIDHKEGIMKFQKWFLEEMADIKDKGNMFTFPVNTISLLYKDGKFADEKFARWACKHNMRWMDSNFFIDDSVNSLSNCCRLKSDIRDLYFNSIGGTALKVGSVKVSTINLARIALETNSEKEFLALLAKRVKLDLHVLHAVRYIIKRNVEKGLLPNFQEGLIDFEHLYNTIGINGYYEALAKFGYTAKDELGDTNFKEVGNEFGAKIFETIHEVASEYVADKDYKVNVEEVPGESASSKFQLADTLIYDGEANHELPLYGNQWIPLGIKTSMQTRIKTCSLIDKYCDGGSICHINLEVPFKDFKTAWKLLNYVTRAGLKYFAFTGKISQDEDGHLFYGETCPECGKPKVAEYARIVGFYTKTATWNQDRRDEFNLRKWEDPNKLRFGTDSL